MDVLACVDLNVQGLETMCLGLDFSKPDFFVPSDCSFSYGGKDCICNIDKTVPCYDFDCSAVLPPPFDEIIVAKTCKAVDMSEPRDISMFIPALADLPDEIPSGMVVEEGMTAMDVEFMQQRNEQP